MEIWPKRWAVGRHICNNPMYGRAPLAAEPYFWKQSEKNQPIMISDSSPGYVTFLQSPQMLHVLCKNMTFSTIYKGKVLKQYTHNFGEQPALVKLSQNLSLEKFDISPLRISSVCLIAINRQRNLKIMTN